MKTKDEIINEASTEYGNALLNLAIKYNPHLSPVKGAIYNYSINDMEDAFEAGVEWAEKHPLWKSVKYELPSKEIQMECVVKTENGKTIVSNWDGKNFDVCGVKYWIGISTCPED